jgi:flavin-binding protein dodecin
MAVVKIVELIGSSTKSWQDAVENVVKRSTKTVRNMHGLDVVGWTAKLDNGRITEYRVNVKVSFVVEE